LKYEDQEDNIKYTKMLLDNLQDHQCALFLLDYNISLAFNFVVINTITEIESEYGLLVLSRD